MSDENRRGDMILAPNEYAFISDETKGDISVFVGPNKTSLAQTDKAVVFDGPSSRFVARPLDKGGIQTFQTAPEGWYVVLDNPAVQEAKDKHPTGTGKLTTPSLRTGKKINISGPVSFPLWPGQVAKVIQGHNLRSNEYLLVRVYDEQAAKENIDKMMARSAETTPAADGGTGTNNDPKDPKKQPKALTDADVPRTNVFRAQDLSMGKLFVIKGTDVSFFIPPTGIEVVPEVVNGEDRYVREAVSLELLEYCLLLDQNGTKRYVHGPAVVFPLPTEKFVEAAIKSNPDKAKAKKFRAQELTNASGIHIRVIADYENADGTQHKAGEELFITGKEQTIYFPREEHAIIKYGDQDIHFGIAIPAGEARYVLNRETGVIDLVKGPQIFLADPRTQVIAKRALPIHLCELLYPGNAEALAVNAERLGLNDEDIHSAAGGDALLNASAMYLNSTSVENYGAVAAAVTPDTTRRVMIRGASKALPGESFDRKSKFTAPRSVVLNTKFDGPPMVSVFTGYAMLLVSKSGNRRVIQGPATAMLEYDEVPQIMTLSRGKPKSTDDLMKTVYLLTHANKVSDIVYVETKDFIKCEIKMSYRVNFEGEPEEWFNVDNYVKFLCDHMRSKIRSNTQKLGIEEFYGSHTELLRDVILGKSPGEGKARPGTLFTENGMRIYDVEILDVKIQNADVEKLLVQNKRDLIAKTLSLQTERQTLAFTIEGEDIRRQADMAKAETLRQTYEIQVENAALKLKLDLAQIEAAATAEKERINNEFEAAKARSAINDLHLADAAKTSNQELENDKQRQLLEVAKLEAQVKGLVQKASAVSPDLIAALQSFGDKDMVGRMSEAMAPLAILGGGSVAEVVKKLLEGTSLANVVDAAKLKPNGTGKSATA